MRQLTAVTSILFMIAGGVCAGQKITKRTADSSYAVAVNAYAGCYYKMCMDNLTLYKSFYKAAFAAHPENDTAVSVSHMIEFSRMKIASGHAEPPPPPPPDPPLLLPPPRKKTREEEKEDSLEMQYLFNPRGHHK